MKSGQAASIAALTSWLGLAIAAFLSIFLQHPPLPVPATAAAADFSAERAIQHIAAIAREPRPIGSAQHAAARDYILAQLRAYGLDAEIQKTVAVSNAWGAAFVAGTVENVVARKRSGLNRRSVLLVAHYDSVPTGPGANDDAAGVATLLETARALTATAGLEKDLIFLFTDAEETGLLGARAFLGQHRWAKEIDVVLNFDGRGNGGPVIMFETSPENGGLIRGLAEAAPYPLANSLSYEIYKRLPNSTDLTAFKEAGLPAMNFAFIHGATHYHTALDNLDNVDPGTVQHDGSYALSLSRYFGTAAHRVAPEADAVYFDVIGFFLVRYPGWVARPLAAGVAVLFGVLLWVGFQRRRFTWRGIATGTLLILIALVAAAGAVGAAWWVVLKIHPGYQFIALGDSYSHGLYVLGFTALALSTTITALGSFGCKVSVDDLFVGACLWSTIAMLALAIWIVGGSYLFAWPLLFAVVALGHRVMQPLKDSRSAGSLVIAAAAAIPGVLLIVPFVHLVLIAMPFALAPALVLPLVLLFALLVPLLRRATERNRWLAPSAAATAAIFFFGMAGLRSEFDQDHRASNHVLYILDPATGRALWVSSDPYPDAWTKQFFGKTPKRAPLANPIPFGRRAYLQASAPVASLDPPEARLIEDKDGNGVRRLRLHIFSPRAAPRISIEIDGETLSATVEGRRLEAVPPGRPWTLIYLAPSEGGFELELGTRSGTQVSLKVADESYGLPRFEGPAFTERPPRMMPAPFFRSDFSLVTRSYPF